MSECIVPGCGRTASNNLGVRLRKPDTSAIWAPETKAHVCDKHARSGARITVFYEATDEGSLNIRVHGAEAPILRRASIKT